MDDSNKIGFSDLIDEQGILSGLKSMITKMQAEIKTQAGATGANIKANPLSSSGDLKKFNADLEKENQLLISNNELTKQKIALEIRLANAIKTHDEAAKGKSKTLTEEEKVLKAIQEAQAKLNLIEQGGTDKLIALRKAIKDANTEASKKAIINNSEKNSQEQLYAQYVLSKMALDKMSDSERKNTVEGQKLEAETLKLKDAYNANNEAVGNYTGSVGNYKIATAELEKKLGILKSTEQILNKEIKQNAIGFRQAGTDSDKLNTSMKTGTTITNQASIGYKKQEEQLKQVKNEIKQTESELSKLKRNEALSNISNQAKTSFGTIFTAAGLAGLAVNAVSNAFSQMGQFIKDSYLAYEEAEKQERVLNFALGERENITKDLIELSGQLQKVSGIDDETIQSQMAFLALQGRSTNQIKKTIQAAIDFSKATGEDFESAVRKLDGSMEGVLGKMAKYDSRLKQLTPEQLKAGMAIDILGEKFAGVAAKSLTLTDRLGVLWNETKENVGSFVNSLSESIIYVISFGQAFKDAGNDAEEMGKKVKKSAAEIQKEFMQISNLQASMKFMRGEEAEGTKLAEENYQSYLETLTSVLDLQKLITVEKKYELATDRNKETLLTNSQQNKLIKERIEALKEEASALGYIEQLESKLEGLQLAKKKASVENVHSFDVEIEATQLLLDAANNKIKKDKEITKSEYDLWKLRIDAMEEGTAKLQAEEEKRYLEEKEKLEASQTFILLSVQDQNTALENLSTIHNRNSEKIMSDTNKKKLEEEKIYQDKLAEIENTEYIAGLNTMDAEIVAVMQKYEKLIAEAEQYGVDTTNLKKKETDEINKIITDAAAKDAADLKKINDDAAAKKKEADKDLIDATIETSNAIIESYVKRSEAKQASLDKELEASKKYEDQLRELAKTGIEGATENLAFEQKKQAEIEAKKLQEEKRQKHLELGMAAITAFGKIAETDPEKALVKTITEITKLLAYINTIPEFSEGVIEFKGKGTTKSDSNIVKLSNKESVIKAEATEMYKPQLKAMNDLRYNPFDYIKLPKLDNIQKNISDYGVINELKELKEITKNKTEYSIDINGLTHEIIERIQRGNTVIINNHKPKGLF